MHPYTYAAIEVIEMQPTKLLLVSCFLLTSLILAQEIRTQPEPAHPSKTHADLAKLSDTDSAAVIVMSEILISKEFEMTPICKRA